MGKIDEARKIKNALDPYVRDLIELETSHCFKVYKAVVVSAPAGDKCGICFMGQTETVYLPYSSACSSVVVGDFVWVGVIGTFSNSIVWQKIDFS